MCLTIVKFKTRDAARKFKKNPRIAKRNITVFKIFKVCRKQLYAPFFNFSYVPGELYKAKICISVDFDCYLLRHSRRYLLRHSRRVWYLEIDDGFHSCSTESSARNYQKSMINDNYFKYKILKCTIPKGSEYFLNDGLLVSNQLKVNL